MKMFENLFPKYITAKNLVFFTFLFLSVVFILRNTDIMILFFASFVLACSLNPFVDKLSAKFSRGTASAIVVVGLLVFVGLFLIPTIILSANEIKTFAINFPAYIDKLDDFINAQPMLDKIGLNHVDIDMLMGYVANSSSGIISHVANLGTYLGTALVYVIIGIMIMYYFMADKDLLRDTFISMFPVQMRKRSGDIHDIITKKIGGYMAAQSGMVESAVRLCSLPCSRYYCSPCSRYYCSPCSRYYCSPCSRLCIFPCSRYYCSPCSRYYCLPCSRLCTFPCSRYYCSPCSRYYTIPQI